MENHGKKDNHIFYTEYWQQLLDLRSSFHQIEVRRTQWQCLKQSLNQKKFIN